MRLKNASHFGDHCFKELIFPHPGPQFIKLLFVSLPLSKGLETGTELRLSGSGLANLFFSFSAKDLILFQVKWLLRVCVYVVPGGGLQTQYLTE